MDIERLIREAFEAQKKSICSVFLISGRRSASVQRWKYLWGDVT